MDKKDNMETYKIATKDGIEYTVMADNFSIYNNLKFYTDGKLIALFTNVSAFYIEDKVKRSLDER